MNPSGTGRFHARGFEKEMLGRRRPLVVVGLLGGGVGDASATASSVDGGVGAVDAFAASSVGFVVGGGGAVDEDAVVADCNVALARHKSG